MKPGIGAHGPYDATAVPQTGSLEEGRSKDTEKCISRLCAAPPQPSRVRGADGLPDGYSNLIGQLQPRSRAQSEPEPAPLSHAAMAQPEASPQSPSKAAGQPYFTARANGEVDDRDLNCETKFAGTNEEITCRHLALQELCDRQKEDSQGSVHHRDHRADRRADQRGTPEKMVQVMEWGLEQRYDELVRGAKKNYAIDHAKLGEFFHSVFREMQSSSKRYMLVQSGNHVMAVRMRVKDWPQEARYVINFYDPSRTLTDKRYFTDLNFEQVKNLQIQSFLEQSHIDDYFGEQGNDSIERVVFVQEVPGDFHVRPLSVPFESRKLKLILSDQQTSHPELVFHLMSANMPGGSKTLVELKAQLGQCASEQKQVFDFLSGKNSEGTPALFIAMQENFVEAVEAFCDLVIYAAEKNLITKKELFILLSAEYKGAPALYIAMQKNRAEAVKAFCNAVASAAKKGAITGDQPFNLLSANFNGKPALRIALKKNSVEAVKAFRDFVIYAAEKNLITEKERLDLQSLGTPGAFHCAII